MVKDKIHIVFAVASLSEAISVMQFYYKVSVTVLGGNYLCRDKGVSYKQFEYNQRHKTGNCSCSLISIRISTVHLIQDGLVQ